jgi:glycine cleavage system H protein
MWSTYHRRTTPTTWRLRVAASEQRSFPADLLYTAEHTWTRADRGLIVVGITDFAQDALGDVVFVTTPEIGAAVVAGQPMGEIESTKSVADVVAPVTGTVEAINERLDGEPELVNADPYGDGWIALVRPDAADWRDHLLPPEAYRAQTTAGRAPA